MLMYQSTFLRRIMCHTGVVQSRGLIGGIKWKDDGVPDIVDYSCYPVVTLAANVFIEFHGTNLGKTLFYHVGKLEVE